MNLEPNARRRPIRRSFLMGAVGACAAGPALVRSQSSRPVRILVGFSAGGSSDIVARQIAHAMTERLGVPVVVENRPGALSLVAIQALKSSAADGQTLMLGTAGALVQTPGVQPSRIYDPQVDFTPVAMIGQAHGLLSVRQSLPLTSVQAVIEAARAKPGSLTYGSAGIGSASHLPMEHLMLENGGSMIHVPFKGDNAVALELASGRLDVAMNNVLTVLPYVQEKRVRVLATSSPRRLPQLPDVPTYAETGNAGLADLSPFTFYALMAPAGFAPEAASRLNAIVNDALARPSLVRQLADGGIDADPMSPDDLRRFIETELVKWRRLNGKVKLD